MAHAWSASLRSMAALSGPASTMTVLRGETMADLFTEGNRVLGQGNSAKNSFEADKRIFRRGGAPLENVGAIFTRDNDRIAAIRRFASLAEVALELRQRGFHRQSDNLIDGVLSNASWLCALATVARSVCSKAIFSSFESASGFMPEDSPNPASGVVHNCGQNRSGGEELREPQGDLDLSKPFSLFPIRNGLLRNAEPLRELSLGQIKSRAHLANLCGQGVEFSFGIFTRRTVSHGSVMTRR